MSSPSDAEEGARMLARHRQSLILEDIRRTGSARVSDLTQRLGVSDMTIRRDLWPRQWPWPPLGKRPSPVRPGPPHNTPRET